MECGQLNGDSTVRCVYCLCCCVRNVSCLHKLRLVLRSNCVQWHLSFLLIFYDILNISLCGKLFLMILLIQSILNQLERAVQHPGSHFMFKGSFSSIYMSTPIVMTAKPKILDVWPLSYSYRWWNQTLKVALVSHMHLNYIDLCWDVICTGWILQSLLSSLYKTHSLPYLISCVSVLFFLKINVLFHSSWPPETKHIWVIKIQALYTVIKNFTYYSKTL